MRPVWRANVSFFGDYLIARSIGTKRSFASALRLRSRFFQRLHRMRFSLAMREDQEPRAFVATFFFISVPRSTPYSNNVFIVVILIMFSIMSLMLLFNVVVDDDDDDEGIEQVNEAETVLVRLR